jgi:hypothetical protein
LGTLDDRELLGTWLALGFKVQTEQTLLLELIGICILPLMAMHAEWKPMQLRARKRGSLAACSNSI